MMDDDLQDPEFTDEQLRAVLKRVGSDARQAAFAAGRPIMIAKKSHLVLIYPDGAEEIVAPLPSQETQTNE